MERAGRPGPCLLLAEEAAEWNVEGSRDAEHPANAGVRVTGLDALDGEPCDVALVGESFLGEVGVLALLPDPPAYGAASLDDPVGVGFAGHSTNADRRTIMSQPA